MSLHPNPLEGVASKVGQAGRKVTIVTGGGRGIGRAIAGAYLREGARVTVTAAREHGEIESLAEEVGAQRVLPLVADVTDPEDCERVVAETVGCFGRVDVLVNNAGRGMKYVSESFLSEPTRFWEVDPGTWKMVDTNVNGPFIMARAVEPSFRLTAENAPAVIGICSHLDGLPLAIELAASRVKLLPPDALLARLRGFHGLGVLAEGGPDLPERQRTMRATLAWSHDLLGENEKEIFRRLGAFAGGCSIGAAETVCAQTGSTGESPDLLTGLAALADASLLQREAGRSCDGEARVIMSETVREYAEEILAASGEEGEGRGRHASYFAALAEEAEPRLAGPEGEAWLDRLEADHGNLSAALGCARARPGDRDAPRRGPTLVLVDARISRGRARLHRGFAAEGRRRGRRLGGGPGRVALRGGGAGLRPGRPGGCDSQVRRGPRSLPPAR